MSNPALNPAFAYITNNYLQGPGVASVLADASSGPLTVTTIDLALLDPPYETWLYVTKVDASGNGVSVTTTSGVIIGPASLIGNGTPTVQLTAQGQGMLLQSAAPLASPDQPNWYVVGS